ncbi:MAG: fatty acid desaturase [Oceanibaculum nanhaiense]|uniref:fatty acid desaturase n=1 Tax=Oceanibaculum nanhaiense TaxID=1909734 RepID=UPI0025A354A7|nr:fatty acid desaturase [Oceanibaculum nanhaiense]MDM7946251.1 fatty acid desaturase [Oceanibaculum nanhaiense]
MTDASVNRSSHRLVSPADLKALSQRSDAKGLARLALHAGLIALASYAIWRTQGTLWVLPAMLLQGLFLVTLFATIHETVHYTAFRNRRLNEAVGWIAALPSLLNSTYYKHFHLAHHRHTQDPARDPELTPPPPTTRGEFWWRITAIPYWIGRFRSLGKLAAGNFQGADFVPDKARGEVVRSVRLMIAFYALVLAGAVATGSAWPLLYWIVPVVMAQPFLRAYLLTEHTGCSEDANGLTNTRTTLAAWPVRLLMWNMPFHVEHHLYPSIPFHALPALHGKISGDLTHLAPGYLPTLRTIHAGLGATPGRAA